MLSQKIKKWIFSHVGSLTKTEEDLLCEINQHFEETSNIELPKKLFEKIHSVEKRRLLGITYTPKSIREILTTTVLNKLEENKDLSKVRISDPCCGSGLFSITIIDELIKRGLHLENIIQNNIYLSDIDKLSVSISMINLYQYSKRNNVDISSYKINCQVIDYLESDEKFDAFITNPPYVKLQNLNLNLRESLKKKYPNLFVGALGLSAIFLRKMLDDLNKNGILGVITQNNLFTSTSAKILRKEITSHLYRIDNFGSEKIFDDVIAYTCLIYLTKDVQENFEYKKIVKLENLKQKPSVISNKVLNYEKWRLGTKKELDDLLVLEREGIPLKNACKIWVGVATQFDKAFVVTKINSEWIGTSKSKKNFIIENDIVKKFIRVSDLTNNQSVEENCKGIIYPYKIISSNRVESIKEDELKEKYPNAYKFLLTWKEELMERDKASVSKNDWYKWGRIQSMIPTKNKLLTKTFNKGPCFYFDKSDSLFSNGYAITVAMNTYHLDFVKEVLNSKTFEYYAKLTSFEIEGAYQCYQKNFIERFCLPIISMKEQLSLLQNGNIDNYLKDYFKLNFNFMND